MSAASYAMVVALRQLAQGAHLTADAAAAAVAAIMSGEASPGQTGAFLMALRLKGETEDEVAGTAVALRRCMKAVTLPSDDAIDTCGTGGDGLNTFNVSTAAAFVVAGAGLPVAKHGNRSASSRCGSADVLEALGVPLLSAATDLERCLQKHNMAFLFAPHMHPAMRHAGPIRREIAIPTVFNLVGPLVNPASVPMQIVGVPDRSLQPLMAAVLHRLGTRSAWVVTGEDGMDELTTTAVNHVTRLEHGQCAETTVDARDVGLPRVRPEDLAGGSTLENGRRIEAILSGRPGPDRDIVLFNAAAALVVGGRAVDLAHGMVQAAESIDQGAAAAVLAGLQSCAMGAQDELQ